MKVDLKNMIGPQERAAMTQELANIASNKESLLMSLLKNLGEIKSAKMWTIEQAGKEFADVVIKEPPAPVIIMQTPDAYDDEEDDEYEEMVEEKVTSPTASQGP